MRTLATFFISAGLLGAACMQRQTIGAFVPPKSDASAPPSSSPPDASSPSLIGSPTPVQRGWEWLNPKPTGNNLYAAWATSPTDIWFVGEYGTIAHSDGNTASVVYQGTADESFYGVWASASDDAWVIGSGTGGAVVLHWDGKAWSDYAVEEAENAMTFPATAIWGSGRDDVWILLQGGEIVHWNGQNWEASGLPTEPAYRDIFGTSKNDVWMVGDSGAIWHFDGEDWKQSTASEGALDPFAKTHQYTAVWGANSSDVWATFEDSETTGGYSHWNGRSWSVSPFTIQGLSSREGNGRQLVGSDASHVYSLLGETSWNGTQWTAMDMEPDWSANALASVPGGGVVVGGDEGTIFQLDRGAQTPLFGSVLTDLSAVSAAKGDDSLWSLDAYLSADQWASHVRRWVDDRWQAIADPPEGEWLSISAFSEKDVWIAGRSQDDSASGVFPLFSHWDGQHWSVPVILSPPLRILIRSIFAEASNSVWFVLANDTWTEAYFWHYDGQTWQQALGPIAFNDQAFAVYPRGDEVWWFANGNVWRWDGHAPQVVAQSPSHDESDEKWGALWVGSESDIWIGTSPPMHWDGHQWSPLFGNSDLRTEQIWGNGSEDVWFLFEGGRIGHWDGTFTMEQRLPEHAFADITGRGSDVWVVGRTGATLHYGPVAGPPLR